MTQRRAYKSTLREKQAQRTRELIVEALIDQICDTGRSDFSMNDVAERAGVSVRTVYRHFPKREDLLDAINEHLGQQKAPPEAVSRADFEGSIDRLVDWFEANTKLVHATHVTSLGRELRARGRAQRGARMKELMDEWLAPLGEAERKRAHAAMRVGFSSMAWRTMREELGLDPEETKATFRWMLGLLVADLERQLDEARTQGGDDD